MIQALGNFTINKINQNSYDYIVVGSGITGATIAQKLHESGKSVLVIEKRNTIGGNCYTEPLLGIDIHKYGAHIFRTSKKEIWDYVNRFHSFHHFNHKVIVDYKGVLYSFPINLMTLYQISCGLIDTPEKAEKYFEANGNATKVSSDRLDKHCIGMIGKELFEKFVSGYTEKQWGKPCSELPASIIKRIPVRTSFNDSYFDDSKAFQGIPDAGGYTALFTAMFEDIDVVTDCDFFKHKDLFTNKASKIIYTGPIDELHNYKYGNLPWRSLEFESQIIAGCKDLQGVPVMNYTSSDVPYTRIIEHKHFCPSLVSNNTVYTKEYPKEWRPGLERYYPMQDNDSMHLATKYKNETVSVYPNIITCGRLGDYAYYDMDVAIERAFDIVSMLLK